MRSSTNPTAPNPTIIPITSSPDRVGGLPPAYVPMKYPTTEPAMKITPPMVGVPRLAPWLGLCSFSGVRIT